MKRIVLISFLFTLLLAGGKKMHANVHINTTDSKTIWDTFIKEQVKFNKLNSSGVMTKYTDFDLEEEFSSNNEFHNLKSNSLPLVKSLFSDKWYLAYNDSLKETVRSSLLYACEPNQGQSTPIYLFHSVLRI
jgi:hypothetical protein